MTKGNGNDLPTDVSNTASPLSSERKDDNVLTVSDFPNQDQQGVIVKRKPDTLEPTQPILSEENHIDVPTISDFQNSASPISSKTNADDVETICDVRNSPPAISSEENHIGGVPIPDVSTLTVHIFSQRKCDDVTTSSDNPTPLNSSEEDDKNVATISDTPKPPTNVSSKRKHDKVVTLPDTAQPPQPEVSSTSKISGCDDPSLYDGHSPQAQVSPKKKGKCQKCSGIDCSNNRIENAKVSFFKFPAEEKRCWKWVINTGREDLYKRMKANPTQTAKQLNASNVLCQEHFEDNQFWIMSPLVKRLYKIAVPTKFVSIKPPRKAFKTPQHEISSKQKHNELNMSTKQVSTISLEKNCDEDVALPDSPKPRQADVSSKKIGSNEHSIDHGEEPDNKRSIDPVDDLGNEHSIDPSVKPGDEPSLSEGPSPLTQVSSKYRTGRTAHQCCSAINCYTSKYKHPELSFFSFPSEVERCWKWVINTRRDDLYKRMEANPTLTAKQLNKSNTLCQEHFEDDQFQVMSQYSKIKRLMNFAVPTIFVNKDIQNSGDLVQLPRKTTQKVLRKKAINVPGILRIKDKRIITDLSKTLCEKGKAVKVVPKLEGNCCVNKCRFLKNGCDEKRQLFEFPANPAISRVWCDFIGRPDLDQDEQKNYLVCSKHFLPSCFDKSDQLKPTAVPTVFFRKKTPQEMVVKPKTENVTTDEGDSENAAESVRDETVDNSGNRRLEDEPPRKKIKTVKPQKKLTKGKSVQKCLSVKTKDEPQPSIEHVTPMISNSNLKKAASTPTCQTCNGTGKMFVSRYNAKVQTVERRNKENESSFVSDKLVVHDEIMDGKRMKKKIRKNDGTVLINSSGVHLGDPTDLEPTEVEQMVIDPIDGLKTVSCQDLDRNNETGMLEEDQIESCQSSQKRKHNKNKDIKYKCQAVKTSISFISGCLNFNFRFFETSKSTTNRITEVADNGETFKRNGEIVESCVENGNVVKIERFDVKTWVCPICLVMAHYVIKNSIKQHMATHLHYDGDNRMMLIDISGVRNSSSLGKLFSGYLERKLTNEINLVDVDHARNEPNICNDKKLLQKNDEPQKQNICLNIELETELNVNTTEKDDIFDLIKSKPVVYYANSSVNNAGIQTTSEFIGKMEKTINQVNNGSNGKIVRENVHKPIPTRNKHLDFDKYSTYIPFTNNWITDSDFEYCCSICLKKYLNHLQLNVHRLMSHKTLSTRYTFDKKTLVIANKYLYPSYIRSKHKTEFCHICGKVYNASNFKHHMMLHENEARWQCDICGKNCANPTSLKIHKKLHSRTSTHPSTIYENHQDVLCELCGTFFHFESVLKKHLLKHEKSDYIQFCQFCPKVFFSQKALALHETRKHSRTIVPSECNICGIKLSNEMMVKHMESHGIYTKKSFTCQACGKTFSRYDTLKQHEKVHGEKKFACDVCNATFLRKCNLLSHYMTHTGERPYPCIVCGWKFRQSGDLFKHYHKHTEQDKSQPQFEHLLNDKTERLYKRHMDNLRRKYALSLTEENSQFVC